MTTTNNTATNETPDTQQPTDPLIAVGWEAKTVHIVEYRCVPIHFDADGRFVTIDDGKGVIQHRSFWALSEAKEYIDKRLTATKRVKKRTVKLPCVIRDSGLPVVVTGYDKHTGDLTAKDAQTGDSIALTTGTILYVDRPHVRERVAEVARLMREFRNVTSEVAHAQVNLIHAWKESLRTPDGYEDALSTLERSYERARRNAMIREEK